ncbi:hypothetical protein HYALB_00012469 [Hymenoscyphus albidus]|uniref:Uncharacterized protein n=1 Tax=Hymenoscyphus albidus TaxID=595503 RepID=A0A9N9LM88_9HELO|nr:hypothetical protein HYALB_00012469 [Hymenoscyphus albidus]
MNQELLLCAYRLQALVSQQHYCARHIDASSRRLLLLITSLHAEPPFHNPLPASKEAVDADLEFLAMEMFKSREISLHTEKFKREVRDDVRQEVREAVREEMADIIFEMEESNSVIEQEKKQDEEKERGLIESAIRGYQRTMMATNWFFFFTDELPYVDGQ